MSTSYQPLREPQEYHVSQQFHITDPNIERMEEHDRLIKSRVRKLRIGIRIMAFACSVVVVSLMTHNLVVFYKTADIAAQGVRLWPANTKLWPTYLTLGVAGLSTIFATLVLLAYCWSTKAANRWNTARFGLTVLTIGFGVVMWALAGGGLNSTSDFNGIGSQSLWSAACDASAQQLQMFDKTVDFKQFCLEQEWGLVCSGIGIGLEVLTIITYIYVLVRFRQKREMRRMTRMPVNPPRYADLSPSLPPPLSYQDGKYPHGQNPHTAIDF